VKGVALGVKGVALGASVGGGGVPALFALHVHVYLYVACGRRLTSRCWHMAVLLRPELLLLQVLVAVLLLLLLQVLVEVLVLVEVAVVLLLAVALLPSPCFDCHAAARAIAIGSPSCCGCWQHASSLEGPCKDDLRQLRVPLPQPRTPLPGRPISAALAPDKGQSASTDPERDGHCSG